MKARVLRTDKQIKRALHKEALKQSKEIYGQALEDAAYQVESVMLCVLHKHFGFGKKRLHKLFNLIEDEFILMNQGVLGRSYTTDDCKQFLKDEFDLDVEASQYKE